jgi:hypothetical protein
MVAILGMIPEEGIGVYIMANLDHVEIRHALIYDVFDLFYDTYLVTLDKKTYGEEFVTFRYNPSGKVEALELMGREFLFLLQKD